MDDDTDPKIILISAGATKTLNALLEAAADNAVAGGMHPEAADEIRAHYAKTVHAMRKLIARLEAK